MPQVTLAERGARLHSDGLQVVDLYAAICMNWFTKREEARKALGAQIPIGGAGVTERGDGADGRTSGPSFYL